MFLFTRFRLGVVSIAVAACLSCSVHSAEAQQQGDYCIPLGTSYTYTAWQTAGISCECGGSGSEQQTPGGWTCSPSVGISIHMLEASLQFTYEEPVPKSVACTSGACERKKPIFCKMRTNRKAHGYYVVERECTSSSFDLVECKLDVDFVLTTEDILIGTSISWLTCPHKPSQLPCQTPGCIAPNDKNGNASTSDADPCPHEYQDKNGQTVSCPFPRWDTLPDKHTDQGSLHTCNESYHGYSQCCGY